MIHFILFHKDGVFPKHLVQCIQQIQRTQTNYKIFLLTDAKLTNVNEVNIININDLSINRLLDIDFYKNDCDPLWKTSFERFFYINDFLHKTKLNDIVHFDNDVLIYKNVYYFLNKLHDTTTNASFTQHKEDELVCGFTYLKTYYSLVEICNKLFDFAALGIPKLKSIFNDMPHEMKLLGHIHKNSNLINILPSTPQDKNFTKFNFVFDPSTYGQYFGGSGNAPKNTVHPSNINRLVDRFIVSNTIKPVFDEKKRHPYIIYDNQQIPICNLHIHSKHLGEFST